MPGRCASTLRWQQTGSVRGVTSMSPEQPGQPESVATDSASTAVCDATGAPLGSTGGGSLPPTTAVPRTGEPQVDTALAGLAGLAALPVHEHAGRFDALHLSLQGTLSGLDES